MIQHGAHAQDAAGGTDGATSSGIEPVANVVLLGASNLSRGFPRIVATAQHLLGSPLRVLTAIGHGRSYGLRSRILVRDLPSILHCRLWNQVREHAEVSPTYALITDIGNDIMYGATPEDIAAWVREALERLAEVDARTVMTMLPMTTLRDLGRWRFRVVKTLFFPRRKMTYEQALDVVHRVDALVRELGCEFGVPVIEPDGAWYGLDPIHIRMSRSWGAWFEILKPWVEKPAPQLDGGLPPGESASLRLARPERQWVCGWEWRQRQPAVRLRDGTTVELY